MAGPGGGGDLLGVSAELVLDFRAAHDFGGGAFVDDDLVNASAWHGQPGK